MKGVTSGPTQNAPTATLWTLLGPHTDASLVPRDCTVVRFESLGSLIEALTPSRAPEVLVVDFGMARAEGLEALDAVLKGFGASLVPSLLLVVTAPDLFDALERVPDDVVVQPMHPAELCGRIDALVQRGRTAARRERVLSDLEERQRMLQEAQRIAAFGSWEWNVRTGALAWSDGLYRIYGVDPSLGEVTYETFVGRLHPEDRTKIEALIGQAMQDRQPFSYTERIIRPDGSVRYLRSRGEVLLDAQGEPRCLAGVCHDVTEQTLADARAREAEASALRTQQDFRRMIEVIPDAVSICHDGVFLYVNPAYATMLGHAETNALIGARVEGILHPDDVTGPPPEHGEPMSAGDAVSSRRLRRVDGEYVTLEMTRSETIDFEGVVAELTVGRDVTARRRLEAQLKLADRMVSVGTMAAGVAHEINNPLAFVVSNLELALEEMVELTKDVGAVTYERFRAMREMLDDAQKGAVRVRAIVQDLKAFSRSTDERTALVSVHDVLDSTLDMVWNEIRHHARLVKVYGPMPLVDANGGRLGQVFLNLLVNAAQAIPEGAADRNEIRVVTRSDELGNAIIEIHDTGTGIPDAALNRIFDPFYTTKPVGTGTGLGLSICHGIVTGYGGAITVESAPGKGSSFRVLLPKGRARVSDTPPAPVVAVTSPVRGAVLVIDDEPLVLEAVRRILARDHDVVTESSGRAAIERVARGERFDVIVCDLMMPDVAGFEVHAALARIEPDQAERMLFLTGGAFTPSARAFLELVLNPRIEKPFDVKSLRSAVLQHLRDTASLSPGRASGS